MFDEVEQFIKRVREMQEGQGAAPRPAPRPEPLDAEIIDAEPVEELRSVGGGQAGWHLTPLDRPTGPAADLISQQLGVGADALANAHIHGAFQKQLGTLAGEDAADLAASIASFQPSDVAQILADPQSFRRAIIVSEILNRPTHRWQ
jgi:hypothetical protein